MSIQIAVRLPDELVAYVDQAIAEGRVKSRAELVARLIARDARRQRAEEDLQRLIDADATDDEEMLAIAKATSATPLSVDQITSIPAVNLHEQCGWFLEAQEPELYDAIQAAFDLV